MLCPKLLPHIAPQKKYRRPSSRGAILPEFAFVMPLMLIFFGGLLELGRVLSQVTWVAQTTYQTALLGAENPNNSSSLNKMDLRATELRQSQQRWLIPSEFQVTRSYDSTTGNNFVRVQVDAQLESFLTRIIPFPLDISVEVVTPHFINGGGSVGRVDRFPGCPSPGDPICGDLL